MAEVYSPDLLATQQEYLLAVKSREQLKNSPIPSISQNGDGLVASAKQRLMLFGVKESQIAELEKAGKPNIRLPIYTPLSGVVIEKMVQQGQYVNIGEVLFNIADLSTVWVEIEVFENEFPNIQVGQQVEIRSQSIPGKPFTGRITFIYPFLDPKTQYRQGPGGDAQSRHEAETGHVCQRHHQGAAGSGDRRAGDGGHGYRQAPGGLGGNALRACSNRVMSRSESGSMTRSRFCPGSKPATRWRYPAAT